MASVKNYEIYKIYMLI